MVWQTNKIRSPKKKEEKHKCTSKICAGGRSEKFLHSTPLTFTPLPSLNWMPAPSSGTKPQSPSPTDGAYNMCVYRLIDSFTSSLWPGFLSPPFCRVRFAAWCRFICSPPGQFLITNVCPEQPATSQPASQPAHICNMECYVFYFCYVYVSEIIGNYWSDAPKRIWSRKCIRYSILSSGWILLTALVKSFNPVQTLGKRRDRIKWAMVCFCVCIRPHRNGINRWYTMAVCRPKQCTNLFSIVNRNNNVYKQLQAANGFRVFDCC